MTRRQIDALRAVATCAADCLTSSHAQLAAQRAELCAALESLVVALDGGVRPSTSITTTRNTAPWTAEEGLQ